jgi:hypothetical protein
MNLSRNPTIEQLRDLLKSCDDNAGHHVIWVGYDGEVHITLLDEDSTPGHRAEAMGNQIRFRYETRQRDNGYVGPEAAQDGEHLRLLFRDLLRDWEKDARGYIETISRIE